MTNGSLLPDPKHVPEVTAGDAADRTERIVATRDHDVIRRWAERRRAEPATGEATLSGPATVEVRDTGAGIRFNFPGVSRFRLITWEEWFENFDAHQLAFVYENEAAGVTQGYRYRIVKLAEWEGTIG